MSKKKKAPTPRKKYVVVIEGAGWLGPVSKSISNLSPDVAVRKAGTLKDSHPEYDVWIERNGIRQVTLDGMSRPKELS
jgi:hypothetical protein